MYPPVRSCIGWAETPIHSHPKPHPSPSKAHPKRVWMGSLGAVTMPRLRTRSTSSHGLGQAQRAGRDSYRSYCTLPNFAGPEQEQEQER